MIPNGNIQSVTVMTKDWARAVVDVTVTYGENLERVFDVLKNVGAKLAKEWPDRVVEQPSILGIEKLELNGVTIRCVVKTPPMKQWDLMREWRRRIKEEFDRQGIDMVQRTPVNVVPAEVKQ